MVAKWTQMNPKCSQMVAKWSQMIPKWSQMTPNWYQIITKCFQMISKWLQMIPQWFWMIPKWSQMTPKWLSNGHKLFPLADTDWLKLNHWYQRWSCRPLVLFIIRKIPWKFYVDIFMGSVSGRWDQEVGYLEDVEGPWQETWSIGSAFMSLMIFLT